MVKQQCFGSGNIVYVICKHHLLIECQSPVGLMVFDYMDGGMVHAIVSRYAAGIVGMSHGNTQNTAQLSWYRAFSIMGDPSTNGRL